MNRPVAAGRRDVADRSGLEALLVVFYRRAFADDLLGPVFVDVARLDLGTHLPVIADFWDTVLFRSGRYRRNALAAHSGLHARAPLTAEHFSRWLALWRTTVQERHAGPIAERAVLQAERVAGAMQRRLPAAPRAVDPERGGAVAVRDCRGLSGG